MTTHTPKRSPVQEVEVFPLLVEPTQLKVNYKQAALFTVLVPVSDMNARQDLHITLHEQDGDRHLRVSIASRFLFTAPLIP